MNDRTQTWKSNPSATSTVLPKGATDCHCHVFGPTTRFPFTKTSNYNPADAPKETLFALHDAMGIERCVIVQSAVHGHDNSVVVDALQARPGRYLGVALVAPDLSNVALDTLAKQGFRGVRFNYMAHLAPGATDAELLALAPRLRDRGMHLQVHMEATMIETLSATLSNLPVTVVIDHIGRVDASEGISQPAFRALLRLLEHPNMWCKVSGCERASRLAPSLQRRCATRPYGRGTVWRSRGLGHRLATPKLPDGSARRRPFIRPSTKNFYKQIYS